MSYRKPPELTEQAKEALFAALRIKRRAARLAQLDLNTELADAQRRGLTVRELADGLDIPKTTISRWSRDVA